MLCLEQIKYYATNITYNFATGSNDKMTCNMTGVLVTCCVTQCDRARKKGKISFYTLYKIGRQFAQTLFERVEWVGGAAESKKLSDDKNV